MKKKFFKKLIATFLVISIIGQTGMFFGIDGAKAEVDIRSEAVGVERFQKNVTQDKTVSAKTENPAGSPKTDYVAGEIIVKFKSSQISLQNSYGVEKAGKFAGDRGLDKKEDLKKANISVFEIRDGQTVEGKIAELEKDPKVEYVQPNFQYYPSAIGTDDTYKDNLWGLDNTGQSVDGVVGTADADIDAPEAWNINEGTNASVIVAVIDTGVAYNHPDLIGNMWDGAACKDENGNALEDCNHGYDFEYGDKTPLPNTSSHGTHIAGTIAAVKNNGAGIVGVAPRAKIMAVKVSLDTANIIKGINFAKQNGAKVINASWGGGASSCAGASDQALYSAIQNFDGLFVVAAGNGGKNHDGSTYFDSPADYGHTTSCWAGLSNIISVAATDQRDALASFSDYGANFVDVAAPGVNIYSTVSGLTGAGLDEIEGVTISNETFETVATPALPDGWIAGGTNNRWGTYNLRNDWGNVLFGDLDYPYANSANTYVTSPAYDLGSAQGADIGFLAGCDTEYSLNSWTDYMALEYSGDSFVTSTEIAKWDEPYLDDDIIAQDGGVADYLSYNIPKQYLTGNFQFRFRWVTNAALNDFDGCFVNDVKITKYADVDGSDGEYDYYNGTSMAAPHVAGLVALISGYKPELTSSQVKDVILNTGDSLPALVGKTVSGKRINAFNALKSLTPDVTAPVLREITAVPASTVNRVPTYIFSSDEAGAVTYSGSCGSGDISQAIAGTNTATFHLNVGIYSDCAIIVTDSANNPSTALSIPTFEITPAANFGKAILSFSFAQGAGVIDEVNHTITATVPFGTDVMTLSPTVTISAGASLVPASATAQNFTTPRTYTVTTEDNFSNQPYIVSVVVSPDPDIALLFADKEALVEGSILGANSGLGNITVSLANPLPALGSVNGSAIAWSSGAPQTISNDGQTITKPSFSAGDSVVTITATLTKGAVTDTKPFTLTVTKLPASSIASVTSSAYVIGAGTVGNVRFGTTKAAFLVAISKGESHQTWDSANLSDIIVTGNTFSVTAEDGITSAVYSVTVLPDSPKDISSFRFESLNPKVSGSISGTNITLNVPHSTDVTSLVPTVMISEGASLSPESGVAQNFTTAKNYTVTAADASTKTYVITVVVGPAPSSGGGGGGGGGGRTLTPPPVTTVSSLDSPLRINSSQAGILSQFLNGHNRIKVEIPKGDVKSDTTFSAEGVKISGSDLQENGMMSSLYSDLIFDIKAIDTNDNAVKSFDRNLTITLTVPDLPKDASDLKLYYFDEADKKWVLIEGVIFGAGTIIFEVNHLTRFAVFENAQAVAGPFAGEKILDTTTTATESDGDIIQCKNSADPFAVYIVKIANGKRYIRHIVSLNIFNYYKHLKWENLKQVGSLEGYSLSGWVRVNTGAGEAAGNSDKVYEINGDQTKHWINMTAWQFLTHGGSEEAIYNINQGESDLYAVGASVMSL